MLILITLASISVSAEQYVLELTQKNGKSMSFELASDVEVNFENAEMHLTGNGYQFILPVSELKNWRYIQNLSTKEVLTDAVVSFEHYNGTLNIHGLMSAQNVNVYSVDGKLVANSDCKQAGEVVTFDTSTWERGVYLVSCDSTNFKIMIK